MNNPQINRVSSSMFPLSQLIKKEMRGDFTQEEGDRIINHIVLLMNPNDVPQLLSQLKSSIHNISEVLLTSILNFQLNSIQRIEENTPSIDERIDSQLTIDEVCKKMKISRPTFYKWEEQGLKIIRIGSRVYVSNSDLNDFIKSKGK
jgi:excisionase family DNA binding protein